MIALDIDLLLSHLLSPLYHIKKKAQNIETTERKPESKYYSAKCPKNMSK